MAGRKSFEVNVWRNAREACRLKQIEVKVLFSPVLPDVR